jgi:hypothetical protein
MFMKKDLKNESIRARAQEDTHLKSRPDNNNNNNNNNNNIATFSAASISLFFLLFSQSFILRF